MKIEPYLILSKNGTQTAYSVPTGRACLVFASPDPKSVDPTVVAVTVVPSESWTMNVMMTADGRPVDVAGLNAKSPEEFWLKAEAANCVHGQDQSELFHPDQAEIAKLNDEIANLKAKLEQVRNALDGLDGFHQVTSARNTL